MLKLGGAVILMPKNFDELTKLVACPADFAQMPDLKALPPFSGMVCEFLHQLSIAVRNHAEARNFPDVATFGFFCRKSNIQKLASQYGTALQNRIGRGLSFHIAPSNVPVNFAYSMTSALLAGNSCIVRVSSKNFPQVRIICECIRQVLAESAFEALQNYISIVQYSKNSALTGFFSSLADIRIIWGGDRTIEEVRKFPILPRCTELTFADRYSLAVIEVQSYLKAEDKKRIAQDFYNDTYLFDQNGCSSPHFVLWLGEDAETAKKLFWDNLHSVLLEKAYTVPVVIAVDKLNQAFRIAIDHQAEISTKFDNLITRVQIPALFSHIEDYRCAGGSFIEYTDTSLNALAGIVSRKFQTVSYFGDLQKPLQSLIQSYGLHGIDRIVPIGKTTDFSLTWDGCDLIFQMSRKIN